jgi:M6 family metalloprotease-like protein
MVKKRIKIGILLIILPIIGVSALISLASFDIQPGTTEYGLYTFEREMTLPNGKTVSFYESGDPYFQYYHDKDGFILLKEDGQLYYAQNDNGRPVSSGVRYTAPQIIINKVEKMLPEDVNLTENPDLLTEYPVLEECEPDPVYNADSTGTRQIANIIIYIVFYDDTTDLTGNPVAPLLDGETVSLKDYFYRASDGGISISNYFPMNGSNVYVYRSPKTRSYYNVDGSQKTTRGTLEAKLLTDAVNAVSSHFQFPNGTDLDVNDDGYVDGVSFLIGGSSSTTWGSLLWPHSWNLASINRAYNNSASAAINGIEVGAYSFNFTTSITLGVICHEFFHVLGAPDLYHYNEDFVPVGDWDIMQFNKDIPQLPLTYMRTQYLGVSSDRVGTITSNGVYSLSPTVISQSGYLAYKIPTSVSGQYFMVEYRSNSVSSTYDSLLPASGLIVYRIKEGVAEGNKNAVYQNSNYPDEVYVFRPKVYMTGSETNKDTRYARSKKDIAFAALSPGNTYFSNVGSRTNNDSYNYSNLFYVNGANSGIVIETLSMSSGSIEFRVQVSGNSVADNYFDDKLVLESAKSINLSYTGIEARFSAGTMDLKALKDIRIRLKTASGEVSAENTLKVNKFRETYEEGERIFLCQFVINDKGIPVDSLFLQNALNTADRPVLCELWVTDADNDTKLLGTDMIDYSTVSWDVLLASKAELAASVTASSRITLGVRKDGKVEKSGGDAFLAGQWDVGDYQNIIAASAGFTHTLLLNIQRRVISAGSNDYGEGEVSIWSDIKLIEAGYNTSYAVDLNGRVYAAGNNDYNQLAVSSWTDIVDISAGVRHAAAVDKYGKVYAAGYGADGQTAVVGITDAKGVACGSTFTAILKTDGTVVIAGILSGQSAVADWNNIIKIAAGENFLIALRADKSVVAAGINQYGQCNTEYLSDIIDLDAGEYHAVFLREDGTVLFTGSQNGEYMVQTGIANLIYDNYIPVTDISFSLSAHTIYTGIEGSASSARCNSVLYPQNATYQKVIYISSDPSVASVSALGTIRAVSPGRAVITAEVAGSSVARSEEITVLPFVELASMVFADPERTVMTGASSSLRLIYAPDDATVIEPVQYTSADPAMAVVNPNGVITAGNTYGTVLITATLTQNNRFYQTFCTVRIVSSVQSIQIISLPTKTAYKYGDAFDVSGGRIRITFVDDDPVEQSVSAEMVEGYDPYSCTTQTITIRYLDAVATFEVTVSNYIQSVAVNQPIAKTQYIYGEPLSLSNITIIRYWANGNRSITALPAGAAASGYNSDVPGVQTVYVSFIIDGEEFMVFFQVTVLDTVARISADAMTKTVYLYGENISSSQNILLYMASGAQRIVPVSAAYVTGYNPLICGVQRAIIQYTDPVGGGIYTTQKDLEVVLSGEIQVFTLDSMGERHLYRTPGVIYYTVGSSLPIEITFRLEDDRQVAVGTNSADNIYYTLSGFSPSSAGDGAALVEIRYKRNRYAVGGAIVTEYESMYLELYVFGEADYVRVTAVGRTDYFYGEIPSFEVHTLDDNGIQGIGLPDYIYYNSELTGEPQTCYIYYRNEVVTATICINDYAVELLPIESKTVDYNAPLVLDVYAVMAKAGLTKLFADEFQILNGNTAVVGTRTARVSYSDAHGTIYTDFLLTVRDSVLSVVNITPIASTCRYGEALNTYSVYRYTMGSGATESVVYNTTDFTVPLFYNTLLGTQTVRITHKATGTVFTFQVEVVNYVASLQVMEGSRFLYHYGEPLSLVLCAYYANGATEYPSLSSCTVTGYQSDRIAVQEVSVAYRDARITLTVEVQNTVKSLRWNVLPPQKNYGYGQALILAGGELQITFTDNTTQILKNSEIASLASSYNPLQSGKQTVIFALGNQTLSFDVTVGAKSSSTYSLDSSGRFVQKAGSIVFYTPATRTELAAALTCADYLSPRIKTASGIYYDLNHEGETRIRSDDTLQIINAAGTIVFSYKLYLHGDADCDGECTEQDITVLAQQLVDRSYDEDLADYDGDGIFSLTDLVNWAKKCAEPSPLNNMANGFISDCRVLKKKEEQL